MSAVRFAALALVCAAVAGCRAGPEQACPAVGWTNELTVELAPDRPAVPGGTVHVACSSPCGIGLSRTGTDEPLDELSAPLSGRSAQLQLDMTTPDSVVVTVLGPDGGQLAELDTDLDWVRVGGSAQCGSPMQASVLVPAL